MVVSLEWRGKGEDIKIAGEFNGWEPSPAARTHDMWQVNLDLQPGRYEYKWVVDGEWLLDESQRIDTDTSGNKNNILIVEEGRKDRNEEEREEEKAEVQEGMKEKMVDEEGEGSGDSDSWERVSVGDCSGEDLSNKPQPGDPKPEPGETNPTLADSTPSVQPGKKKVNIERVFSPGSGYNAELNEGEKDEYMVGYWDTLDYTLMKEGLWLKQIKNKWILRRLDREGVSSVEDKTEIEKYLSQALGIQKTLENYVSDNLGCNIQFNGSTHRYAYDDVTVEFVQEGDLCTVALRLQSELSPGLKKIYETARHLGLDKLNLV